MCYQAAPSPGTLSFCRGGAGQQHPTSLGTPSRGLRHLLLLLAPLLKHRALPQARSHCSQVIKLEPDQGSVVIETSWRQRITKLVHVKNNSTFLSYKGNLASSSFGDPHHTAQKPENDCPCPLPAPCLCAQEGFTPSPYQNRARCSGLCALKHCL